MKKATMHHHRNQASERIRHSNVCGCAYEDNVFKRNRMNSKPHFGALQGYQ